MCFKCTILTIVKLHKNKKISFIGLSPVLPLLFAMGQQLQGVNFTNILNAAFKNADPKSAKKTDSLTVFFALLGFVLAKALQTLNMKC